jgi:hypothetical protein
MFETHVHIWGEWGLECDGDMQADMTSLRNHRPIVKNDRVVVLQDLYIVFAIELKLLCIHCLLFRLNVVFLDQLEKDDVFVYTWHQDFTKFGFDIFLLGHEHRVYYYTTISMNCSSKLSPFLVCLNGVVRPSSIYDSDNPFGILKLLFYIHLLLFRLLTHLKDVMCLLTQDVTILRN